MNKHIFFLAALSINAMNGMQYQLSPKDLGIDHINIKDIVADHIDIEDTKTAQMMFDCLSELQQKIDANKCLSSFSKIVTAYKKVTDSSIIHFLAVHLGYNKELKYLLQKGANPNEASDLYPSPLFSSTLASNPDATKLLIDHGADILIENTNDKTNFMGSTILLCAVHKYPATKQDIETVRLLLNHKDVMKLVNKKGKTFGEKQYTPLQFLATHAQNIQDCPVCSTTEMCLTEEAKKEHTQYARAIQMLLLEKSALENEQDSKSTHQDLNIALLDTDCIYGTMSLHPEYKRFGRDYSRS